MTAVAIDTHRPLRQAQRTADKGGEFATTRLRRRRDDPHFSQSGFRALSARCHTTTEGRLSPFDSLEER